jgi:hypothetical protein
MIDRSILNVLESAKAYAALLGSLLTGVLALGLVVDVPEWVVAVAAALTWFATWKVPNATPAAQDFYGDDGGH